MTVRLPALLAGLAAAMTPAVLSAQSMWLSPTPPPAIRIVRETARFGTSAAHLANERSWVAALRTRHVPYSYVGTVAASGAPEFWFIGGARNFVGLERLDESYQTDKSLARRLDTLMAREVAFVTEVQTVLAAYRPELSHLPMFIEPETRHFWVTTFTLRPGEDDAFVGTLRAYIAAYAAAKVGTPWVTYQMVAGGTSPTYYVIMPLESYGGIDDDLAAMPRVIGELPAPATIAAQLAASTERMETQVLTISPQISYVPEEFAKQDAAFWLAR